MVGADALGLLGLQWSGVTTTLRAVRGRRSRQDAGQGIADVRDPRLGSWRGVGVEAVVAATLEVSRPDPAGAGRQARRGAGRRAARPHAHDRRRVLVVRCFRRRAGGAPVGRGRTRWTTPRRSSWSWCSPTRRRSSGAASGWRRRPSRATRRRRRSSSCWQSWRPGWRQGRPARSLESELPEALDLLTAKPALYIANVDQTGNAGEWSGCGRSARSAASRRSRWTRSSKPRSPSWTRATGWRSWTTSASSGRPRPGGLAALRGPRPDPVLHHRARRRPGRGRSAAARTPRRRPARSTPTSPAGSSGPR